MEPLTKVRSTYLNETAYMYNSVKRPGFVYVLTVASGCLAPPLLTSASPRPWTTSIHSKDQRNGPLRYNTSAYCVCAHFVVSSVTCAVTVKSFAMVTRSILSWSRRSIPGIVVGGGESRGFFRQRRLSVNTTSPDLARFSLRWFSSAHDCMWFHSRSLEVWFTAGTMRYVSSANLHNEFPG